MIAPPAIAEPFDRRARRRQRARMTGDADFLRRAIADELAARLAALDRRFERVLELGAGGVDVATGFKVVLDTSAVIAGAHRRGGGGVLAVTGDSDVLAVTGDSGVLAVTGDTRVLAVTGDEDRLPFADASFDLVVAAASLHGVNDLPGALIRARRALVPGGMFVAGLFGGTSLIELRRDLLDAEGELTGRVAARIVPMVDPDAAAGLLQRAGFADPVVEADTLRVRYDDLFALLRDIRAMGEGNYLATREPLRRDVLADAARRFGERADAGGRVSVTVQVLYLTGWAR